jgi:hypothetical protein
LKNIRQGRFTRRELLGGATAAAFTIIPRNVIGGTGQPAPSDKLNIAGIGVGDRGRDDLIDAAFNNNVVALCDVDENMAGATFVQYPNAKLYKDFRNLLDKEQKNINAVTIAIPDHMHATAALWAMERGISVYLEAPLAQTVWETRLLTKAAAKYKVATQMGNQGHSSEATRIAAEVIAAGDIGEVTEVHAWNNGGFAPDITEWPRQERTPNTLQWDLWLGRAQRRDYSSLICPFEWRGFQDFGTGVLGDQGIHIMGSAHWALKLGSPIAVKNLWVDRRNNVTYAGGAMVKYEFAAREAMPPVSIFWYGGSLAARLDFATLTSMGLPGTGAGVTPDAGATPDAVEGSQEAGAGSDAGAGTGQRAGAAGAGQRAGAAGQRAGGGQRGGAGGGVPFIPSGMTAQSLAGFNQVFIGTKAYLATGGKSDSITLFPRTRLEGYKLPKPTLPRSPGHMDDWIAACKNPGKPACSHFSVSGPYTEWVLLGNIAEKFNERLEWDAANMRFTNNEQANEYITPKFREGWTINDVR